MLAPDSRLKAALTDAKVSNGLLNELHQQILFAHDASLLPALLGKYLAIAASRAPLLGSALPSAVPTRSAWLQSATRTESRRFSVIASAAKAAHDVAKNAIHNMK